MKIPYRSVSVALFGALGLFYVAFGLLYASVEDLLWFHAAAVPEKARADVLTLYLALMDLIGAASSALGALGLFTAFTSLRRGDRIAAYALGVAYAVPLVGAAVVAERLAAMTGAPTSWHVMGGLLGLTGIAVGCAARGQRAGSIRSHFAP